MGGRAFWNLPRQGQVKPMAWYGYFLESPIKILTILTMIYGFLQLSLLKGSDFQEN